MKRMFSTLAVGLAVTTAGLIAPSPTSAEEGVAQDTSPTVVSLQPMTHHRQSIFEVQFDAAQSKERRFITSTLAVKDTTDRLFLGQALSCTSPSGVETVGIETGRNFWKGGLGRTVASFVLRVNESGRWTCASTVNVCAPGKCDSGTGSGTLTLDTGSAGSVMKVSKPLDMWSTSSRLLTKDIALKPGRSATLSKTVTVGAGSTPTAVAEISFSNCIEATYPNVCASVPSRDINGSATASVAMTVTQVPAKAGVTCAVVKATRENGAITRTISADQHHATFSLEIPQMTLSTSPGCSNKLTIATTITSRKGNGIAVESGSRNKPMSLISVGAIDSTYQVVPVLS